MKSPVLVLMRHGQSEWNKRNLFTGWVDVPLSQEGIEEALQAGEEIAHISFDIIFISALVRAKMTAFLAMSKNHEGKTPVILHDGKRGEWAKVYSDKAWEKCIPVKSAWELNERMYGALQGLDKDETRAKYGKEQVHIWRRSYDVPPPEGESLEMTAERAIPYFKKEVVPALKEGKNVLISAHGNSLRSIIMELDGLSKEEVVALEIPTGKPITYRYENGTFVK